MSETGDSENTGESVCADGSISPSADSGLDGSLELELQRAYDEHAGILLRYALMHGRDMDLARDAVQEAFLRFHVTRIAGQTITQPRAWLVRVVSNYLNDEARRSQAQKRFTAALPAAPVADPQVATDFTARVRAVLSPREFETMQLRTFGFSYDEIAQTLEISAGTVNSLMSRAMRKIRQLLPGV